MCVKAENRMVTTNTVLIYYYEKHLYNIRFTWVVQRKM